MHQIMGMDQIYLRRRYGKHNYVETQMRENHRERESTISMAITMVFSGLLGFLRSILFHIERDLLFVQVVSVE